MDICLYHMMSRYTNAIAQSSILLELINVLVIACTKLNHQHLIGTWITVSLVGVVPAIVLPVAHPRLGDASATNNVMLQKSKVFRQVLKKKTRPLLCQAL